MDQLSGMNVELISNRLTKLIELELKAQMYEICVKMVNLTILENIIFYMKQSGN